MEADENSLKIKRVNRIICLKIYGMKKDKNSYVKKINNSLFSYDLGTRVYSSRIIGKIPDLVMHGGGNTSCKTIQEDILEIKLMFYV